MEYGMEYERPYLSTQAINGADTLGSMAVALFTLGAATPETTPATGNLNYLAVQPAVIEEDEEFIPTNPVASHLGGSAISGVTSAGARNALAASGQFAYAA